MKDIELVLTPDQAGALKAILEDVLSNNMGPFTNGLCNCIIAQIDQAKD